MPIDWGHVIETAIGDTPAILGGAALVITALRRKLNKLEENQARIEKKADGQHEKQLAEIKQAGKYEGKEEAKHDARYDREQLIAVVKEIVAEQSKQRGRRRSDPT